MKKILIIGSGGAGKSTFARRLREAIGIELIHLDKIYWQPNWIEPSKDEWKKTVENLLGKKSWIMDGNYGGTMQMRLAECDTVIFLDVPRVICIYRILKRLIVYREGNRPDMAEGCAERFDWKFIKWIWNYPTRTKPKTEKLLERFEKERRIIRLKSKTDVENFFMNLESPKMKSV